MKYIYTAFGSLYTWTVNITDNTVHLQKSVWKYILLSYISYTFDFRHRKCPTLIRHCPCNFQIRLFHSVTQYKLFSFIIYRHIPQRTYPRCPSALKRPIIISDTTLPGYPTFNYICKSIGIPCISTNPFDNIIDILDTPLWLKSNQ